jgi:hypothetical protein
LTDSNQEQHTSFTESWLTTTRNNGWK